jgi:hypothetical protein
LRSFSFYRQTLSWLLSIVASFRSLLRTNEQGLRLAARITRLEPVIDLS